VYQSTKLEFAAVKIGTDFGLKVLIRIMVAKKCATRLKIMYLVNIAFLGS
jgi:hypothetical protein